MIVIISAAVHHARSTGATAAARARPKTRRREADRPAACAEAGAPSVMSAAILSSLLSWTHTLMTFAAAVQFGKFHNTSSE